MCLFDLGFRHPTFSTFGVVLGKLHSFKLAIGAKTQWFWGCANGASLLYEAFIPPGSVKDIEMVTKCAPFFRVALAALECDLTLTLHASSISSQE